MKIPTLPFTVTDWSRISPTVHPGETGEAICRTFTIGDLRVRAAWDELPGLRTWRCGASLVDANRRQTLHCRLKSPR
jgi:hypothetical protein